MGALSRCTARRPGHREVSPQRPRPRSAPFGFLVNAMLPRRAGSHRVAAAVITLATPGQQGRIAAAAGLDRGLLIGRDDELGGFQAPALEAAGVQVQHHRGPGGESGSRGKIQEPCRHGFSASSSSQRHSAATETPSTRPVGDDLVTELSQAPPAKWDAPCGRQLTGDRPDLDDHRRGGKRRGRPWPAPAPTGARRRPRCAAWRCWLGPAPRRPSPRSADPAGRRSPAAPSRIAGRRAVAAAAARTLAAADRRPADRRRAGALMGVRGRPGARWVVGRVGRLGC